MNLNCVEFSRALRAHIPYVPCICIIVQLGHAIDNLYYMDDASLAHEQKVHA